MKWKKTIENIKIRDKNHKIPDKNDLEKELSLKNIAERGILKLFEHVQEQKKKLNIDDEEQKYEAINKLFKETKNVKGQDINWSVLRESMIENE